MRLVFFFFFLMTGSPFERKKKYSVTAEEFLKLNENGSPRDRCFGKFSDYEFINLID